MTDPTISIVCGTYNRLKTLQRMVNSVRRSIPASIRREIIIVDNGSTDGTPEWLAQQSDIRTLQMGEPVGAIKAFTEGAKAATGKYVLLATDDCHFPALSIMTALRYIEDTPTCGAVAFGHNKYLGDKGYEVAPHRAHDEDGQWMVVIYPQIALVRRWLGDLCGWWGGDHPVMSKAFTYGGDDFLGAGIWERGYTVDSVDGVIELEDVIPDTGRKMNEGRHAKDAALYWSLYPNETGGHLVRKAPQIDNPHRRELRVLCALQFNPQMPQHKRNKRSWLGAWEHYGLVYDYDYEGRDLAGGKVDQELAAIARDWQPDVIFTQVHHQQKAFNIDTAHHLRIAAPDALMVNWCGDYWPENYLAGETVEMLRYYDLQLVQNAWVIEPYCAQGICAAYIPHSFETVRSIPLSKSYDAVFAGNGYNPWRLDFAKQLHSWGVTLFGGFGEVPSQGTTLYDFAAQRGIYRAAKVAISPMQFEQQAYGFVSNRFWEILAAGGALCLQQHSLGLDDLTGLRAGTHYVEWHDFQELHDLIDYYIDPAHKTERQRIAQRGYREVLAHHSFEARVDTLVNRILPEKFGDAVR